MGSIWRKYPPSLHSFGSSDLLWNTSNSHPLALAVVKRNMVVDLIPQVVEIPIVIFTALRKEIHLMHNTSLKTIIINSFILINDSPRSHPYDWIIDILSQITSRFIERVTLVIFLNTLQQLVSFNLPALAALFAYGSPTFSELSTRLRFRIYGAVDRAEARAAITESLRELDSQGRLEFGGGRDMSL